MLVVGQKHVNSGGPILLAAEISDFTTLPRASNFCGRLLVNSSMQSNPDL